MTDQIDKNYKNETEKEHAIRDALDLQTVSSAHNIIDGFRTWPDPTMDLEVNCP